MNTETNRYIVTGCNGYLGKEICRQLAIQGESVIGVSRTSSNSSDLLEIGIECVRYEVLSRILLPTDYFIHCAGKTGNSGSWEEFEETNHRWTMKLFELASEHKVNCFVFISSIASFGYVNRKDGATINEMSIPMLHQCEYYGRSKLCAEQSLLEAAKKSCVRLVILKPGLIFGKKNKINEQQTATHRNILDPQSIVPLVYIDNFIDALCLCVRSSSAKGVYVVVDDEQPSQKELVNIQNMYASIQIRPLFLNKYLLAMITVTSYFIRVIQGRKKLSSIATLIPSLRFCSRRLKYDCSRIKEELRWSPHISLDTAYKNIALIKAD